MKDNKLTLVLMAGLPGVGKSTLASVLGHDLHWYVISKDEYKLELLRRGREDERAKEVAYRLSFFTAYHKLAKEHVSVILDSAANSQRTIDNAMVIVRNYENIRLKVILCYARRDIRNQRVQKKSFRISDPETDPDTLSDYQCVFNHLPTDHLLLETDKPLAECLAKAIAYLKD